METGTETKAQPARCRYIIVALGDHADLKPLDCWPGLFSDVVQKYCSERLLVGIYPRDCKHWQLLRLRRIGRELRPGLLIFGNLIGLLQRLNALCGQKTWTWLNIRFFPSPPDAAFRDFRLLLICYLGEVVSRILVHTDASVESSLLFVFLHRPINRLSTEPPGTSQLFRGSSHSS